MKFCYSEFQTSHNGTEYRMKAILIYFYVAILPLIIHGDTKLLKQQLEKMASKNKSINGIFQPANCGYLGEGYYGSTFKGKLLKPIEREVAMKFTPLRYGARAQREYETYTYLGAINNTDVECYGIPAVYYYGRWDDYILMAITLLDSEYDKRLDKHQLKDVDIMIIAREVVKISKYIHSRGVLHSDMKLDNIMFRKQMAFVIDFNTSGRLLTKFSSPEFGIPPKDVFEDRRRLAPQDWAAFLNVDRGHGIDLENYITYDKNPIVKEEFRQVFEQFSNYERKLAHKCTQTERWQLYDDLYRFISAKIDNSKLPKPVFVSWLTGEERKKAKNELNSKQLPDISSIKDRFENVFTKYPEVNYNYFA